jgi:hypothetical protein
MSRLAISKVRMGLLSSGKWRNNNAAQQIYEVSKIMVRLIAAAKISQLRFDPSVSHITPISPTVSSSNKVIRGTIFRRLSTPLKMLDQLLCKFIKLATLCSVFSHLLTQKTAGQY